MAVRIHARGQGGIPQDNSYSPVPKSFVLSLKYFFLALVEISFFEPIAKIFVSGPNFEVFVLRAQSISLHKSSQLIQ